MAKVVPVYIFLGFLEGGKTSFIQKTLEDEYFNSGEKTLLIMCEQGIEELDESKFASPNVRIEYIEKESDLTTDKLLELFKSHKTDRVMFEYNGMWQMDTLKSAIPSDWQVYQCLMFAETATFKNYMNNMKSLMADKVAASEVIFLNRYSKEFSKEELHSGIRLLNRKIDIVFEYANGWIENDTIKDELPYDLTKDEIVLKDEDFGMFYIDSMDEPKKYSGKTVTANLLVCQTDKVAKGCFVGGRYAMTCCANDIAYLGLVCKNPENFTLEHKQYYTITATIKNRFNTIYGKIGPVLTVVSVAEGKKPDEEVVYFR